ncbi:glycosyltransferase family 2 protein [Methanobacterium sp.]|uniref:glycosyltransferase family 2 protein n=1 Tax=Methanobacterium sp. TaxID=2164 RepID=UPI002ABB72BD|nr:glycosyltransferase family 2 protein [Methanobacterium sp.]MDY9922733.1 glycosyltransferase family 2 protein [Methanobacterium sp.]
MNDKIFNKESSPGVSIIILNWNGWKDTIECLTSISNINYPIFDIIVVDNASEDESLMRIQKHIDVLTNGKPTKFTLIKNKKNYGFAEGNNIGIRFAIQSKHPDYVLFLNNDTTVDKNFLYELVRVAEDNVMVGSVQSLLLKPGGKIVDSMGQELTTWSARDICMNAEYKKLNENMEIFGACAAAALYRADVLEEVGLFDKDFFAIYEDVDLSWKIRLAGFKSILAVNSIVYHKRNISKSVSEIELGWIKNDLKRYHLTKNMLILAIRYHPCSFLLNPKYVFKFFLTLMGCFYYSLRSSKLKQTFRIFKKNFRIRKNLENNHLLKSTQNTWIK